MKAYHVTQCCNLYIIVWSTLEIQYDLRLARLGTEVYVRNRCHVFH
jgi:hypothetical protein